MCARRSGSTEIDEPVKGDAFGLLHIDQHLQKLQPRHLSGSGYLRPTNRALPTAAPDVADLGPDPAFFGQEALLSLPRGLDLGPSPVGLLDLADGVSDRRH